MDSALITGAGGFVGRALCAEGVARGVRIRAARRSPREFPAGVEVVAVNDIDENTDWRSSLDGCGAVVHLAARVHVMKEGVDHPMEAFRKVNVLATLNLARQAAESGVRRFVFISSIGVNGARTDGQPFTADDVPRPHSPYAESKYEAESGLRSLSGRTGMEVVIIRPPLVYGADAPGNFGALMRWLARGLPLPLGAIANQRSLVGLDNLVDLILTCLSHPSAAGEVFLISDDEDVSTPELLRRMGLALGRPARLIPVPAGALELAAALLGQRNAAQSLCGSLQVDIEKTRQLLGWRPPFTLEQSLKKAVQGFHA